MALLDKPKTGALLVGIVILVVLFVFQIFLQYVTYEVASLNQVKTDEIHTALFGEDKEVIIEIIEEE